MNPDTFYFVAGLNAPSSLEEEVTIRRHARNHNAKIVEYLETTIFEEDYRIDIISLSAFKGKPNKLGTVKKRKGPSHEEREAKKAKIDDPDDPDDIDPSVTAKESLPPREKYIPIIKENKERLEAIYKKTYSKSIRTL